VIADEGVPACLSWVVGVIEPPARYPTSGMKLRLRVNGEIQWVKLNGQPAEFDRTHETVALPRSAKRIEIEAGIQRSN